MVMKAFARRNLSHPSERSPGEGSDAPSSTEAEVEAEEFVERLGDLDRFIGGPAKAPHSPATLPSGSSVRRPTIPMARNLPALPTGALAPISHPVPPAPAIPRTVSAGPDANDEAQDFLERLGDLDRFIGAPRTPRPT